MQHSGEPEAPRPGERVDLEIESIAAGGEGVGHVRGWVTFVPYAAPGDVLHVEVTAVERRLARARIVSFHEPSRERRAPRCRHFGECGGCVLQHLTPAAQRAAKERIVRDALKRLAGLADWPPIEVRVAAEYGQRTRARLWVDDARGRPRLGFARAGSTSVCAIEECPVLVPALERRVLALQRAPESIPRAARRIHAAVGDDATAVAFVDGRERRLPFGDPLASVRRRIAGFDFTFDASGFFQGHQDLVPELVEEALRDARGVLAFDLYAGAGLFTLPLTRTFGRVVSVEEQLDAVARARANARANGVSGIDFRHDAVETWLPRQAAGERPEFVLVDPPRRGLAPRVLTALCELAPRAVSYVSCDPATLARDVGRFALRDWRLESIVAFDLFPQTAHVECVARLVPAR